MNNAKESLAIMNIKTGDSRWTYRYNVLLQVHYVERDN